MKYVLAALLLGIPVGASADELILRDGKKVEWVNLHDEGDSYEVTLPQGTKITVKKEDVEKIVPGKGIAAPLTGATFAFDKKKTKLENIDLLALIDPKRDTVWGDWKKAGADLIATADGIRGSRIEIPFTPVPEEYDLTIVVERKEGDEIFFIGLIGGGKQFAMAFDAAKGTWTGFEGLGTERMLGGFFKNGQPRTIVCMIRKEGVVVQVDGKDFAVCKTNWDKVNMDGSFKVRRADLLSLGINGPKYAVHRVTLTSPKK